MKTARTLAREILGPGQDNLVIVDNGHRLLLEWEGEWNKRVNAARVEGLRMALATLPAMEPTGEYDDEERDGDPTCSVCKCLVSVEDGTEWEDGDVCYHCAADIVPKARRTIEALIAKAEK